ncbi:MAG: hypothetical protein NTY38_00940 [Acidobacteria bacterium]|nr:hypothetical protein [Acidobacteriota bacterium]
MPEPLHLVKLDIEVQLAQPGGKADITVAARFLHLHQPGPEFGRRRGIRKVPQQVDAPGLGSALDFEFCAQFDTADQIEAEIFGHRPRQIVAGERVVIGDSERFERRMHC